jgi:hypothetical protein
MRCAGCSMPEPFCTTPTVLPYIFPCSYAQSTVALTFDTHSMWLWFSEPQWHDA